MDTQDHAETLKSQRRRGLAHFAVFFVLIWAGIITKRVFGHPEYMMLFHGPAAVFLVMSGMHLTWEQRRRWLALSRQMRGQ